MFWSFQAWLLIDYLFFVKSVFIERMEMQIEQLQVDISMDQTEYLIFDGSWIDFSQRFDINGKTFAFFKELKAFIY